MKSRRYLGFPAKGKDNGKMASLRGFCKLFSTSAIENRFEYRQSTVTESIILSDGFQGTVQNINFYFGIIGSRKFLIVQTLKIKKNF